MEAKIQLNSYNSERQLNDVTHNLEAVNSSEQQLNDMKHSFRDRLNQLDHEF